VPFEADAIRSAFGDADLVMLVGTPALEEVWHDPGDPFPAGAAVASIDESAACIGRHGTPAFALAGDLALTLEALLERVDALMNSTMRSAALGRVDELQRLQEERRDANETRLASSRDAQPMTPAWALVEIAAHTPANAVVVDESITASLEVVAAFDLRRPGDYYAGRGGGIGQGVAGALGVQVANPDRPVLALSGDGSAMYSIQALWTAAHHDLPVVFVVLANREYRVLKHNLDIYRQRFGVPSNKPYPHMDLTKPVLDFSTIAAGMGVTAETIAHREALGPALERAFAARAPRLIEVIVAGKES
jgi:benzoylformate decarboxylase